MAVKIILASNTVPGVTDVQDWDDLWNNNFDVFEQLSIKALKIINPDWEFKGTAGDTDSAPGGPSTNDAYIAREDGTIFAIAGVLRTNIIFWNGAAWEVSVATGAITPNLEFPATTNDINFDVTAKYLLRYMIFENTTGNVAVLDLGTTAFTDNVFSGTTIAANDITTVSIFKTFSFSADQTLYLNTNAVGSSWNGSSIDIYVIVERITF